MKSMGNKYLILLLFFSLFSSAQETDTTKVTISNRVAKAVIKDLTKYDYCEKEVNQFKVLVIQLEKKNEVNEQIIASFGRENKLREQISENKDKQITNLEGDLKTEKNRKLGTKILLYVSIAANIFLITKL